MKDQVKAASLPLDSRMPARLARVFEYWKTKRAGRPSPPKVEIDPTEFPTALAYMLLAKAEPGPPVTFRFSLVGEGVHYVHGHSLKGLTPLDLQPRNYGLQVQQDYLDCYATWQPRYHAVYVESEARLSLYLRLLLPLTDSDGAHVTHLLAVELHESERSDSLHSYLPQDMQKWLQAHDYARN